MSWKQPLCHTKVYKTKPVTHFNKALIYFRRFKRLRLFLCLRYVFHSARILLDPSYKNRVEYFGQLGSKNCSLRISDVRRSDSGTYVFYLITNHTMHKMPEQSGIQLLVAGGKFSFMSYPTCSPPSSQKNICNLS